MEKVGWRFTELILVAINQIAIGERINSLDKYIIENNKMTFQNSKIILRGVRLLNLSMLIACSILGIFDIFRIVRDRRKKHRVTYEVEEIKVLKEREEKSLGSVIIDLFFLACTMITGFAALTVMCFFSQQDYDKDLDEFDKLCNGKECDISTSYYWRKVFEEVIILAFPLFCLGVEVLVFFSKILKYCASKGICPKWLTESDYSMRQSEETKKSPSKVS